MARAQTKPQNDKNTQIPKKQQTCRKKLFLCVFRIAHIAQTILWYHKIDYEHDCYDKI